MVKRVIVLLILFFISSTVYAIDDGVLSLDSDKNVCHVNNSFVITIGLDDIPDVYGLSIKLRFNPEVVKVKED